MNEAANIEKAKYLLKTLLFDPANADLLDLYEASVAETERWNELATTLMSYVCEQPEDELLDITKYLSDLGHLDIARLAQIELQGNQIDNADQEVQKIRAILHKKGLSDNHASTVLRLLCQLAQGLNSNFGGKIQRYFRSYGEAMLKDIPKYFPSTGLDEDALQHIFTHWLQKVLNMPLISQDKIVAKFCRNNGITVNQLWAATDELDLGVAIVEDLLRIEAARVSETQAGYVDVAEDD